MSGQYEARANVDVEVTVRGGRAMRLRGKRVVVTGAAGGIGRAFCDALVREGARVACLDRDAAGLREVVDSLVERGAEAFELPCDASDWAAVDAAADAAAERLGGLDVCVANAGGASGGQDAIPFLDMAPTEWRATIDRNLNTSFNAGLSFARKIAASGGGSIIFVTSQLAEVVRPGLAHYAAAKGGVHQLMRGMALDLIPHGIRVNAIAPGPIRHERNRAWFDREEVQAEMLKYLPMGRTGRPDELVGALVYLASDESSFTTGTTITVDGGYTLV